MKKILYLWFSCFMLVNCSAQETLKSITTKELKTLLAKEKIQLVDVRTPAEIEKGSIETAIFANYFSNNFYNEVSVQLDKNKPVYLYCRSGNRSGKSAKILQEKGFDVYNVLGGYNQWKKENKK